MTKKQFLKGLVACIITLIILYIGQLVWQSYAVAAPLDKVIQTVKGVEKVTLSNSQKLNEPIKIDIQLNKIDDIQKTYNEINEKIENTMKNKPYTLEIEDSRTAELDQLYNEINYYLQEALIKGSFPLLSEMAQQKSKALNVKAQVYVDDQNVYIQLTKEDHALYAVSARDSHGLGGNSE